MSYKMRKSQKIFIYKLIITDRLTERLCSTDSHVRVIYLGELIYRVTNQIFEVRILAY